MLKRSGQGTASPGVRQVLGACVAVLRPVRRWLLCLALVVALLVPTVLPLLDHHGAERIPTHTHPLVEGGIIPSHVHAFAVPHTHVGPTITVRVPTTTALAQIGQAAPTAVLSIVVSMLALLLLAVPSLVATGRARSPLAPAWQHQFLSPPPRRPPAPSSVWV